MISPFLSIIFFPKLKGRVNIRYAIWLGIVWYGLTFAIGEETSNSDQERYFTALELFRAYDWSLLEAINNFDFSEHADYFRYFTLWLVSRFTDNGYSYMLIMSTVLGFFMSYNITVVLQYLKEHINVLNYNVLLLFAVLFFSAPLTAILGVRFIIGVHFLIFLILKEVFDAKRRMILLSPIAALLFHFGLWPLVIIILLTYLLNHFRFFNLRVLSLVYLMSFSIGQIVNTSAIASNFGILKDDSLQGTVVFNKGYTYWSDDRLETRKQDVSKN